MTRMTLIWNDFVWFDIALGRLAHVGCVYIFTLFTMCSPRHCRGETGAFTARTCALYPALGRRELSLADMSRAVRESQSQSGDMGNVLDLSECLTNQE